MTLENQRSEQPSAGPLSGRHPLEGVFAPAPGATRPRVPWLAIAAAALVLTIAIATWRALEAEDRAHAAERAALEAESVRNEISAQIESHVLSLERMARRWEALGPPSSEDWTLDTRLTLDRHPGLEVVIWVEPGGRVEWAVARGSSAALLGIGLVRDERRRAAMTLAQASRQVVFSRAVLLETGDRGFLACVPIYQRGAFAGTIVGMFRFDRFFEELMRRTRVAGDYTFAAFDGDEPIFSRGTGAQGPPVDTSLSLHGIVWRLRLQPVNDAPSPLPGAVLRAGILLSLVVGAAVNLAVLARRRAAALAGATRALEEEMARRAAVERALLRSEEHYRELFRRNPAAVHRSRPSGELLDCNDAFATTFGFQDRTRALAARLPDLFVDPADHRRLLERLREEDTLRNVEVHLRRADATRFWAVSSLSLLPGDEQGPLVEGTLIDVSPRKRAQEELDSIFNASLDLLAILDPDATLRRVNPAWTRLLGRDAKSLVGGDLVALLHPDDREVAAAAIEVLRDPDVTRSKTPNASFEARLLSANGEAERWVVWNVTAVPSRALIVAAGHEITERKAAEQALQDSERRYRDLFEHSQGLIYVHDEHGVIVSLNQAAAAALGYDADEIVGRNLREFLAPELRREFTLYLRQARGDEVLSGLAQVLTRAGETRIWLFRGSRFVDRGRQLMLVHAQDATELKRAEEALRESESAVRALYRIVSSQELAFADKVQALLDLGTQRFDQAQGHLARLRDGQLEVMAARAQLGGPERGSLFPLAGSYASHVVDAGEAVAVQETIEEAPDAPSGTAFLGLPIRVAGRLFGVLAFAGSSRREAWKAADLDFLQLMALWVSAELEREQRGREAELLAEMSDMLETCTTSEEGFAVLNAAGERLFPERGGEILLAGSAGDELQASVSWNDGIPGAAGTMVPGDCWALRRGRTQHLVDTRSGLLCKHYRRPLPASALCVPMAALGETLGVLFLRTQPRGAAPRQPESAPPRLSAEERRLAEAFADRAAMALANLRLRETLRRQSISDALTGVYNRRYMEEALTREIRRAGRRSANLGMILLDLDHFKRFNDTWGHEAGDLLLRALGEFLRNRVRGEDIACRYGGEEFALILPEATLEAAARRAEELRLAIKGLVVEYGDQKLGPITLSLGVAVFPDHGATGETLLRAADVALYEAKTAGRDRVVVASNEATMPSAAAAEG